MAITKSDQQKSPLGSLAQEGRTAGAGYVFADLGGRRGRGRLGEIMKNIGFKVVECGEQERRHVYDDMHP